MSPLDPQIPPAGEEVHLPGPTMLPVYFSFGLAVALIGVLQGWYLWVPGTLLVIYSVVRWIRESVRELDELPLEHHH